MKLFQVFPAFIIVALFIALMPASCSKTGYTIIRTAADSATQIIIANDEMNVNYEFDQVINEALLATTISKNASGNTDISTGGMYNTIANAIIDTTHINDSAIIRITYAGKNADLTKGRSGTVTLHFAVDTAGKIIPWKNAGASIAATFDQYEVVVLSNNKSVWMNGTATFTNVSGGLLKKASNINLPGGSSLTDKESGQITFTYDDNSTLILTWTWGIKQARTITLQNALLSLSVTGDTTVNGLTNVSTYGQTRFNDNFYTSVTSPVVQTISSTFLLSNPVSGEKAIHGIAEPLDIVYGVNNVGTVITTGTPYGYKITWTSNGAQGQSVVSY